MASAQIFEKRPSVLSFSVQMNSFAPVVFRAVVNDQQLVGRRSSSLNDTGAMPTNAWRDADVDVQLWWIEVFTGQAFMLSFSVPMRDLPRYDADGRHAGLTIRLFGDGKAVVETPKQALLDNLRLGTEDKITEEMDRPTVLSSLCANRLPDADEMAREMAGWVTDDAKANAVRKRDEALANGRTRPAPKGC